jgi:DNA-binding IclR family transcriptional regulator
MYVFTDINPDMRITWRLYCASRLVASASPHLLAWIASVSRMPARPHRTVDRVVQILETVSLSPRGVTLAELATALDAAKTSVQELTNGLLARGYLIEEDRRFHVGPGPFIIAARANKLAALSLDHQFVAELAKVLGCTVLVGVRVGDSIVFTDHMGDESPALTFVARTHARRPLYTSAAGKTLLANVPDDEMNRLLDLASPEQADEVRQFLTELPEIRSRGLAFNRGVTLGDAFAVATPLLAPDGSLIAAVSAAVDASGAERLDDIGEELKKAIRTIGRRYGLKPR